MEIPKHGKQKMSFCFACLVISIKPQGEMEILACENAATVVAALHMQESPSHLVHRVRLGSSMTAIAFKVAIIAQQLSFGHLEDPQKPQNCQM